MAKKNSTEIDPEIRADQGLKRTIGNPLMGEHERTKKKRRGIGEVEWGLSEVITKMYGLENEVAECEEEYIRNLKNGCNKMMVLESDSSNNADADVVDTLKKLVQDFHGWEQEVARERKEKLEGLIQRIKGFKTDQVDVNRSLSERLRESGGNDEVFEALKLIMQWLEQLEADLFWVVTDLLDKMPNKGMAAVKFRDFKSTLEELKRNRHGKVPRVVYRILAVLEGKVGTMEEKNSDDSNEKEILLREFQVDQIYQIILQLEIVLYTCLPNLDMDIKSVLSLCEEVLKKSEKDWNEIKLKIFEPMNRY